MGSKQTQTEGSQTPRGPEGGLRLLSDYDRRDLGGRFNLSSWLCCRLRLSSVILGAHAMLNACVPSSVSDGVARFIECGGSAARFSCFIEASRRLFVGDLAHRRGLGTRRDPRPQLSAAEALRVLVRRTGLQELGLLQWPAMKSVDTVDEASEAICALGCNRVELSGEAERDDQVEQFGQRAAQHRGLQPVVLTACRIDLQVPAVSDQS